LSQKRFQEKPGPQISPEVEKASKLRGPSTLNVTVDEKTIKFRILEAYRYRRFLGGHGIMIACKIEDSPTFHLWWNSTEDPRQKIIEAVKLWLKTKK